MTSDHSSGPDFLTGSNDPMVYKANGASSIRTPIHLAAIKTALLLTLAIFTGCENPETRVNVESFRNPAEPETFTELFDPGYFRINTGKTYEIVLELKPRLLEVQSGDAGPDADLESELVWTSQYLHIQLLWQAYPGKTYAESTQTNAAIAYCLVNGESAISYEGAGFVYFQISRDGKIMTGRIESASMRPTRFLGTPVDLFGPCRINGTFTATPGHREVAHVRQKMRRVLASAAENEERVQR